MKYCLLFATISIACSCKITPDSSRDYSGDTKSYKLQLSPAEGSQYHYDIRNRTESTVEINDRKIINTSITTIGINYDINKDTSGNFILHTKYDRVHFYSKNDDVETEMDGNNASFSMNPVEKMLGSLKTADIYITISPSGKIKSSTGYKELASNFADQVLPSDESSKIVVQKQWEKLIGERIVRTNVEELFRIFPDSAVHIGEKWKLTRFENNEINLIVKTSYRLKGINNDIAMIEAEGEIRGDSSFINLLGYNKVSSHLKGWQRGEYEMETKTGMLISAKMKAHVTGDVSVRGTSASLTMDRSLRIAGRRLH